MTMERVCVKNVISDRENDLLKEMAEKRCARKKVTKKIGNSPYFRHYCINIQHTISRKYAILNLNKFEVFSEYL